MAHLILAGAGHAHLMAIRAIPEIVSRGHTVTCVGPADRHYYSGMGPGMLGGAYTPEEISFPVRAMVESRGGTFVRAAITAIDPDKRILSLTNGQSVTYDVLSLNTGSGVPGPDGSLGTENGLPPDVWRVKPIEKLIEARDRLATLARERGEVAVIVAGGGPAGVEMAGNAHDAVRKAGGRPKVTLLAGNRLLRRHGERLRALCMADFSRRGIAVVESPRLERFEEGRAILADGAVLPFDAAFLALGVVPSPLARAAGLPTGPSGGLLVGEYLNSPAKPEIFGGGDCIDFAPRPLDKVGVYAVRQNPVLAANLAAALDGRPLTPFVPGSPDYLLLFNLGGGKALFRKWGVAMAGEWAFALKDHIDRRFMRRFADGA